MSAQSWLIMMTRGVRCELSAGLCSIATKQETRRFTALNMFHRKRCTSRCLSMWSKHVAKIPRNPEWAEESSKHHSWQTRRKCSPDSSSFCSFYLFCWRLAVRETTRRQTEVFNSVVETQVEGKSCFLLIIVSKWNVDYWLCCIMLNLLQAPRESWSMRATKLWRGTSSWCLVWMRWSTCGPRLGEEATGVTTHRLAVESCSPLKKNILERTHASHGKCVFFWLNIFTCIIFASSPICKGCYHYIELSASTLMVLVLSYHEHESVKGIWNWYWHCCRCTSIINVSFSTCDHWMHISSDMLWLMHIHVCVRSKFFFQLMTIYIVVSVTQGIKAMNEHVWNMRERNKYEITPGFIF